MKSLYVKIQHMDAYGMEEFVRARTEDQFNQRRDMIMKACDEIYERDGFLGVTFNNVSAKTSFTRPALYNYYKNREEMLLDLLKRELLQWTEAIKERFGTPARMTKEEYCRNKVELLSEHVKMCQLLSDLYLIERECTPEDVAAVKKIAYEGNDFVCSCIRYVFPEATDEEIASYQDASIVQQFGTFRFTHMDPSHVDAYRHARPGRSLPDFKWMLYNAEMCLMTMFEPRA